LEAGKNYRLRVPKDTPAKQFWSLTVYDRATWAFIKNPLDRAGLSSFNLNQMKTNSEGSVDLYFGAKRPDGLTGVKSHLRASDTAQIIVQHTWGYFFLKAAKQRGEPAKPHLWRVIPLTISASIQETFTASLSTRS
jgi:hypothetical protein